MEPKASDIVKDATKLQNDYFGKRDDDLRERREIRFRELAPRIPASYKDTAVEYRSPVVQDEGTQICSLIYADPVPHIVPPFPEDQPATTKVEKFLIAFFQELECYHGSVWWKNTEAQVHQKISWIYSAPKRDAYAGGPSAPKDATIDELVGYAQDNDRYKRTNTLPTQWDYRHVPTDTMYWVGPHRNPHRVYEIKLVDEMELMAKYDLVKVAGRLEKAGTLPSGTTSDQASGKQTVKVIEYWDKDWCKIIVQESGSGRWFRSGPEPLVLDSWKHEWGRTPYFAAPAFENEVTEEHLRYESPLDPLIAEVPHYNDLRTMQRNVGTLRGYPTWQDVSKEGSEAYLDASAQKRTHEKFTPGVIYDLLPGHEIRNLPMDIGPELLQEVQASEQRIRQFSLSDVSKGISPGADTANSAISQLRRLQRSALSPLSKNQADQWREACKFMLERVKLDIGEPVYVYARELGDMVELAPEDIITMNIQVKVSPDTGQDMLIEEKQAFELWKNGGITEIEFHERRGKENPEEYAIANQVEDVWASQKATLLTQVLANLGNQEAIAQMIAASQETGDARNAVPEIMRSLRAEQEGPTGMGQGSGGMPRDMAVRSPAIAQTTQPQGGVGQYA